MKNQRTAGFTLIEVLIALAILAIALTALIRSNTQSITGTRHVQDKTLSHLVAMQGIALIELGFLPIHGSQTITQKIHLFNQVWFMRARVSPSRLDGLEEILITTSASPIGPYHDPLLHFRAKAHEKN